MVKRRELLLGVSALVVSTGCAEVQNTTASRTEVTTNAASPTQIRVNRVDIPKSVEANTEASIDLLLENTGEEGHYSIRARRHYEGYEDDVQERGFDFVLVPTKSTREYSRNIQSERVPYQLEFEDMGDNSGVVIYTLKPLPIIDDLNLVSEWEQYGDAVNNAKSEAVIGDTVIIAFRHQTYLRNSKLDITEQVRIFDSEHNRVDQKQYADVQLFDGSGYHRFEHALRFDTSEWGPGKYTVELLISDEASGYVSEPAETSFTLSAS